MKRPSTVIAGFSLATALFLSSCGVDATQTLAVTEGETSAVATSSVTGAVAELTYDDLEIDEADLSFDVADAVDITLADGASQGGTGVSVDADTVTISAAGTYHVSGTLTSGSLVVDAPDGVVNLVLDGVDITAASVAAIDVVDAEQVVVWLPDGAENSLTDAEGATVDEEVEDSPNATLFSTADLWIAGDGTLNVTAHAADAITSKDTLVMSGGNLVLDAADDGIRGKDHLVITGGTLTVDAQGDSLRADNESVSDEPDAAVGVIWIDGGTLDLTAGADAADAARQLTMLNGDLTLAAGDDGLHSDNVLRVAGGNVDITDSVEGIEGAYMYLSGGEVSVVASDDGINVSGGLEGLTTTEAETGNDTLNEPGAADEPGTEAGGRPAGGPPMGGTQEEGAMAGAAGPDSQMGATDPVDDLASLTVSAMEGTGFGGPAEGDNGTRFLELSDGTYVIDTDSDGVDVNGAMTMSGGTLVVSGTDNVRQGAIDVDDTFTISGGTLAANGMSTMAVAPGNDSTQATLALTFSGTMPAGTLITITDGDGEQVASFSTVKASDSFIYSDDALEGGADYEVSVGGEATGTSISWLMKEGTTTGGDAIGTVPAA
ncbi:MAG: carbohydrate-binding domain-containing protein [Ornithinimicrobium sp.]